MIVTACLTLDRREERDSGSGDGYIKRAAESVTRARFSSDKIDDSDMYFLLDWALEKMEERFEGVLLLCRNNELVKAQKMKILERAFDADLGIDVMKVMQFLCDPLTDYPLPDCFTVAAMDLPEEVILGLTTAGALNLDACDSRGRSLFLRIVDSNADIALALIERGVRVDLVEYDGMNALDYLIEAEDSCGAVHIAKLLLQRGLKMKMTTDELKEREVTPLIRFLKFHI